MENNESSKADAIDCEQSVGRSGRVVRKRRRPSSDGVSWDQIIDPSGWLKIFILGALIFWLYWNEINSMVSTWINDGNWSHGFIIPLFSIYFLHQRREKLLLAIQSRKTNWFGLGLLIVSFLVYLVSIYPLKMGYPRMMAMLMTIMGTVLFCCGWRVIKIAWLPILYLFFAMPLPTRLYVSLTMPMRRWASTVSSAVLNAIPDLEATATSVIIEGFYKGKPFQLNVAEACAGMRLMMAFFALSVAMAYLSERPAWHRIILVLSAFPIALFCNFVRVTITGILYIMVDPRLAEGGFHTTLGLLMLPLAFFLYWGIAAVLNKIYEDVDEEEGAADV